ncbi:MAG: hypothetical protein JKP90_06765 [Desulfofustis sp. PB-SRB1]|nr:hypothetical protein [Desulfofustis sp. PB-SRB1]
MPLRYCRSNLLQVGAADLKGGDPSGRVLDPDAAQCGALAQEKGADIDVRGLVGGDGSSPPLGRHD